MATSPKPWPDSTVSASKGITGKFGYESHRETCPERLASCVPMGCLATPMEFLRTTARSSVLSGRAVDIHYDLYLLWGAGSARLVSRPTRWKRKLEPMTDRASSNAGLTSTYRRVPTALKSRDATLLRHRHFRVDRKQQAPM